MQILGGMKKLNEGTEILKNTCHPHYVFLQEADFKNQSESMKMYDVFYLDDITITVTITKIILAISYMKQI